MRRIRQVLEYSLRQAGHDVTGVERGNRGLALARAAAGFG
jgi:DNA-binding response OmpR family regulator